MFYINYTVLKINVETKRYQLKLNRDGACVEQHVSTLNSIEEKHTHSAVARLTVSLQHSTIIFIYYKHAELIFSSRKQHDRTKHKLKTPKPHIFNHFHVGFSHVCWSKKKTLV